MKFLKAGVFVPVSAPGIKSLTQEVFDRIAECVPPGRGRAGLAVTCRRFQRSVERLAFSDLLIRSDAIDEADRSELTRLGVQRGLDGRSIVFTDVMTRERMCYLKVLRLNVVLRPYTLSQVLAFESDKDRNINNHLFSAALEKLFDLLSKLTERQSNEGQICSRISLIIENIGTPLDPSCRPGRLMRSLTDRLQEDVNSRCRFKFSYLSPVRDPPVLPLCISRFTADRYGCRNIDPALIIFYLRNLSNLRQISLRLPDDERHYDQLRRWNRFRLAGALNYQPLKPNSGISLRLEHDTPAKQDYRGPDLVSPYKYDQVCAALRHWTSEAAEFSFQGLADESLFWPMRRAHPLPFWQNLRRSSVTFDCLTPLGDWYFVPPRESDESQENGVPPLQTEAPLLAVFDIPPGHHPYYAGYVSNTPEQNEAFFQTPNPSDADLGWPDVTAFEHSDAREAGISGRLLKNQFRNTPDWEMLEPLVLAFARACAQMPALVFAEMKTQSFDGRHGRWGVIYTAPGEHHHHFDDVFQLGNDRSSRRLLYCTGCINRRGWHLPNDVRAVLREIGGVRYHGSIEERLIDLHCMAHQDVSVDSPLEDPVFVRTWDIEDKNPDEGALWPNHFGHWGRRF